MLWKKMGIVEYFDMKILCNTISSIKNMHGEIPLADETTLSVINILKNVSRILRDEKWKLGSSERESIYVRDCSNTLRKIKEML